MLHLSRDVQNWKKGCSFQFQNYFLFTVTDVSPIIIDEENGIVYSPALRRSDYMAQRLKDMKEKRENLSPTGMCSSRSTCWWTVLKIFQHFWTTRISHICHFLSASQMVESCSPTRLKPSLGRTPTLIKLICKTKCCDLLVFDKKAGRYSNKMKPDGHMLKSKLGCSCVYCQWLSGMLLLLSCIRLDTVTDRNKATLPPHWSLLTVQ